GSSSALGALHSRERTRLPRRRAAMRNEPRDRFQQRALSRAVRADQTDELAGPKVERYRLERDPRAVPNADAVERERHEASFPLRRRIRCRKKGAPIRAVTTPSLSSGPGGIKRIAISAASVSAAPARKLGPSSRLGWCPTHGRSRCGTTRPTKPMTPLTATAAPTASAVPPTTSHCVRDGA